MTNHDIEIVVLKTNGDCGYVLYYNVAEFCVTSSGTDGHLLLDA